MYAVSALLNSLYRVHWREVQRSKTTEVVVVAAVVMVLVMTVVV